MTNLPDPFPAQPLNLYINAALGKKAMDLVVLDVRELSSIADVFIICSGRSNRQVMAIAEHIQVDLKKHGITPLSVEGKKEGHWVLLDYGHVVIHVLDRCKKNRYKKPSSHEWRKIKNGSNHLIL
ncbi:MAG: ribosome silencing factor [Deltaproteobacteria bacterium]|nr:ribosome silencing factor [Deltaproteobacteria bacterium]